MKKTDGKILKRGLKRTAIALLTAFTYAFAIAGFIVTAFIPGYLAVLMFAVSLFAVAVGYCLLYGQGLNRKARVESKGEAE